MDILEKGKLPDGRNYEVIRVVTPDPDVPEELIRYFIASFGFDTCRKAVQDLTYWRLYFRESLAGHFAPEVIDHHYVLRVEGVYAGRIWFGYNTRTGHGNFGNVYTEMCFPEGSRGKGARGANMTLTIPRGLVATLKVEL